MKTTMTINIKTTAIILVFCLLSSCSGNKSKKSVGQKADEQPSIMVFAAASLTDVLSEIVDSFEVNYHIEVKTNLSSSGTLARQIEQGGMPDVYISASKNWANYVDSLGFILKGYKSEIAKNTLVLIAPVDSHLEINKIDKTINFLSLLGDDRLSMGDPNHVPAGKYAKQALEYFGWYKSIEAKMLPAKDVRSALMVVEMGEVPAGIVYGTDAQKSKKVKILGTFPEESHKPIVYVAGVCKNNSAAIDFFAYLTSEKSRVIWTKYGFQQ